MDLDSLRAFCLSLPHAEECLPFDEDTLVFKVAGKMFLYTYLIPFTDICVKCDPDTALELRERYVEVQPGYHMNKKHWNTISLTGSLHDAFIREWILHSFGLVVKGLPKKTLAELPALQSYLPKG